VYKFVAVKNKVHTQFTDLSVDIDDREKVEEKTAQK